LADNSCCFYYVALKPATVVHLEDDGWEVTDTNTQIIPAKTLQLLGPDAAVGDIDYWDMTVFAPISNGTHGALVALKGSDLSFKAVSAVVDEPLAWVVVDYNTDLAYTGGANTSRFITFDVDSPDLALKGEPVAFSTDVQGVAGATFKSSHLLYLALESGSLHTLNTTSGDVAAVDGTSFETPVRGLANIWRNDHGKLHTATPTHVCHYSECAADLMSV